METNTRNRMFVYGPGIEMPPAGLWDGEPIRRVRQGDGSIVLPGRRVSMHLMVQPVDALVGMFAEAGATYITFHPDASTHVDRTLQLIRDAGCKSGLVFNPATSLDALKYVMDKVDMILLMSVNPGFGGQSFIPSTLDKLREARKLIDESGLDIRLEVDGGVGPANIAAAAEAGADTFVAGSAIFGKPDYKAVIDSMREALASIG